jgi:TonB family protein
LFESKMFESKALIPKSERVALAELPRDAADPKQRSLMVAALVVLLAGLGVSLYQYRDFWFPDTDEAEYDQPATSTTAASVPAQSAPSITPPASAAASSKHRHPVSTKPVAKDATPAPAPPAMAATTTRTVLPPLEVEVVAGDSHRTIRPGSNSLRVDLQPGTAPQTDAGTTETAANVTNNAAERVQISRDTADLVRTSVRPGYPLLARQMKVQGSVILQALIGKDGTIQDLRVVSGPPILASAAQDAVRQWHFKPHYQGSEAVETQAKITVNFTISTN